VTTEKQQGVVVLQEQVIEDDSGVCVSYNNKGSSSNAMLHNTRRITMPGILATTTIWRQDTDDDPYCLPSPTNIDLFLSNHNQWTISIINEE